MAFSDFNGSEDPLSEGGVWSTPGGGFSSLAKVSGQAGNYTGGPADCAAIYLPGTAEESEIEIGTPGGMDFGPALLDASGNGYVVNCNSTVVCQVYTITAPLGFSPDPTANGAPYTAGMRMKIARVGANIVCYQNGTPIMTISGAAFPGPLKSAVLHYDTTGKTTYWTNNQSTPADGKDLRTHGPGVTPDKRRQFTPRTYGYTALSNALVGTTSLTFGGSGTLSATYPLGRGYMPGPGSGPDYMQMFHARPLGLTAPASTGPIVGSASITFGQTGALAGGGELIGATSLTFGQSGALTASGVLAGTSQITFGQTGALTGAGALVGNGQITFGQAGTLDQPGSIIGIAALVFGQSGALLADGSMVGAASITFNASAQTEQSNSGMGPMGPMSQFIGPKRKPKKRKEPAPVEQEQKPEAPVSPPIEPLKVPIFEFVDRSAEIALAEKALTALEQMEEDEELEHIARILFEFMNADDY